MRPRVPSWLRFRALASEEIAFLRVYFGDALDPARIRLAASFGRRSYAPWGPFIGLCRRHFEGEDPAQPVALARPRAAAVFAHEATHVWQRQHGRRVSFEGACLQVPYSLGGKSPYCYQPTTDPANLLAQFEAGNIEQQGQMVEDYVLAQLSGRSTRVFALVAARIRA